MEKKKRFVRAWVKIVLKNDNSPFRMCIVTRRIDILKVRMNTHSKGGVSNGFDCCGSQN